MKMTSASMAQRLGDLDQLHLGDREAVHGLRGGDCEAPDCPGSPARRRSSCESRCVRTGQGGSRPRKTFSATVMCGTGPFSSCSIMAMPEASASAGLLNSTSRPLRQIVPPSAAVNAHDDREKGVDFPAPVATAEGVNCPGFEVRTGHRVTRRMPPNDLRSPLTLSKATTFSSGLRNCSDRSYRGFRNFAAKL